MVTELRSLPIKDNKFSHLQRYLVGKLVVLSRLVVANGYLRSDIIGFFQFALYEEHYKVTIVEFLLSITIEIILSFSLAVLLKKF